MADDQVIRGAAYLRDAEALGLLAPGLADAYERKAHAPDNFYVRGAYAALKEEVSAQLSYAYLMGFRFNGTDQEGYPYNGSDDVFRALDADRSLYVFTGGDLPADHPLSEPFPWADRMFGLPTFNDAFRAVHDLFGHYLGGRHSFGAIGELRAWRVHYRMMTIEARAALTAETLAQNAYVNFGRHLRRPDGSIPKRGEPGYVPAALRPYAAQKACLITRDDLDYRRALDDGFAPEE